MLFEGVSNTGAPCFGRAVSLFTLVPLEWSLMVLLLLHGEIVIKSFSYSQLLFEKMANLNICCVFLP